MPAGITAIRFGLTPSATNASLAFFCYSYEMGNMFTVVLFYSAIRQFFKVEGNVFPFCSLQSAFLFLQLGCVWKLDVG